jgi:hypothetical protein
MKVKNVMTLEARFIDLYSTGGPSTILKLAPLIAQRGTAPPINTSVVVTITWEEEQDFKVGDQVMWEYTQHTVMGRDGEWLWIRSSINGSHHTVHESKVSRV